MLTRFTAIALFAAILPGSGCFFDRPTPECSFACGAPDDACPDDYSCRPDGLCKRSDVPDDFACPNIDPPSDGGMDAAAQSVATYPGH